MRRAFLVVFLKELKDSLRDRRTALMVFVASILTGPVTLVLVAQFVSGLEEKAATLKVRMVGQQHAPSFVNFLQRNDVEIEEAPADYEARVREGRLDAVIVVPEDFDARFTGGDAAKVEIVFDDSRAESGPAIRQAERLLRAFNRETGMLRMVARGVSPDLVEAVKVEHLNTATPRRSRSSTTTRAPNPAPRSARPSGSCAPSTARPERCAWWRAVSAQTWSSR